MSKNIAIFLDGTWNDKEDGATQSNVALLHNMVLDDGTTQVSRYDQGVGTDGLYDAKLGGLHGVGLAENVKEAYQFLARNYEPEDKVYVFGFSRGAFTARSLTGLIYGCGLPIGGTEEQIERDTRIAYEEYRAKRKARMKNLKDNNTICRIAMLGVWDTVGALGIPVSLFKKTSDRLFDFHNTKLNPEVEKAVHAVAADEKRKSFEPTLWDNPGVDQQVDEVWFAGVHSDIGGGYVDRHFSNITLKWMAEHAIAAGLKLSPDVLIEEIIGKPHEKIHMSSTEIFGIPIGTENRYASITSKVHPTLVEKMTLDSGYTPAAFEHLNLDRKELIRKLST